MWIAGGAIVIGASDSDQEALVRPPQSPPSSSDPAVGGRLITIPPQSEITIDPGEPVQTAALSSVPLTTGPPIIISLPIDAAASSTNAVVEACDGRWAVSLGSTVGEVKGPDQFLADVQAQYNDLSLTLLKADSCASLVPGRWVVFGGIYPSSDAAISECATRGLTSGDECFALPLTSDPQDRSLRVFPEAGL